MEIAGPKGKGMKGTRFHHQRRIPEDSSASEESSWTWSLLPEMGDGEGSLGNLFQYSHRGSQTSVLIELVNPPARFWNCPSMPRILEFSRILTFPHPLHWNPRSQGSLHPRDPTVLLLVWSSVSAFWAIAPSYWNVGLSVSGKAFCGCGRQLQLDFIQEHAQYRKGASSKQLKS